jgi:RNase H-like domain found in reverse transcriptase/Integrase core domain/Chromo (CHRromatin Organisation MOdifier) domain/Integrase zinc binding domain
MTEHNSKKQAKIAWNEESIKAFHSIKESISRCPLMHFIDNESPIHLFTDASDYGVGGALFQLVDGVMKPIAFVSKSLSFSQLNWSTIQKEAYGVYLCCFKLDALLRDRKFTIHTDHKNLIYMRSAPTSMVGRWFMALQELDFSIEYVKGKDNIVADAMSRLCPNLTDLVIKVQPESTGMEPNCLPGPFCGALQTLPDMTDEQREALHMCHNRYVGHGGVERTVLKLLSIPISWTEMRQHAHLFIQQCACCQKMNATRVPIHVHKYVTSAYLPFQVLNIDFIGPFPDESFVLVIICSFTRWTELYWCEDSTAKSATTCLLQQFGRYGSPQMIRSDRGSHFANDLIKQFLLSTGTPHNLTLAYSKQENAIVERANKEVNRYLRAFLFDTIDVHKYKNSLPFIQRILNSSIHSSTGASPASLLFGNQVNLDRGILSPFPQLPDKETPASKVVMDMYHIQDTLIAQAQTALRTMDELHMSKNPTDITVFPVGSYVLAKYPTQPPTRLHTLWRGPYEVKSIHKSDYTLLDITTKKFKHIHVSNLKQFVFDPNHTDPADVARRDYMEFFIESILEHKGNSRRKSEMKFLVKWLNFDDSHNTWEPWNNLRLTDALHDYLRLKGLSSIIPK